jgi:hypothetical protein
MIIGLPLSYAVTKTVFTYTIHIKIFNLIDSSKSYKLKELRDPQR